MRFESSKVFDTIEQHLSTDPLLAQAVVDLAEVARYSELDGGRGINLIRLGMVIDALGRYLRDGGVFLYPVAPRQLLSDAELTSKERMLLGRWTDAGLIETTQDAQARVPEIADLTGLPIISRRRHAELAGRYPFLAGGPLRVLAINPRDGGVLLVDGEGGTGGVVVDATPAARVVGKAKPVGRTDPPAAERRGKGEVPVWPDPHEGAQPPVRIPPHIRVDPSSLGASLLARAWRCGGFDCPGFGPHRPAGQPVPQMRRGVPVCPRHDEHLTDVGVRPAEVAVALAVEGLRRRRFVVREQTPVLVGRSCEDPADISVGPWLHEAAANWISPVHLRLELLDGRLVVTDMSDNGTLVWVRTQPQSRPSTERLHHASYPLGEWDSVELYTGIELCHADRRPKGVDVSSDDPRSVLIDAPTVAHRRFERR